MGSNFTEVKNLNQEEEACILDDSLGTKALENTGEAVSVQVEAGTFWTALTTTNALDDFTIVNVF